jgi:hypothetical protein
MKRIVLSAFVIGVVACGGEELGDGAQAQLAPAASDQATACVFNTRLLPENEVRTDATDPVESTARGHAQIKIRTDGTLQYKVSILNQAGETFVAGHVHQAPAGSNGGIVVTLFGGPASDAEHFKQHAEVTISAALAEDICENPSDYYVNYHTTQDPQGAVRGQLGSPTAQTEASVRGTQVHPDASCWGQATKVFAQMGEMGEHASAQETPRLGLRNLARALHDAGVLPDDSLQSLGAFVAAELGFSIEACM